MMRRGQTATEYLIILAVVIVIALIVVGVIGGIPGVGSSGQAKASTAYWSTLDPVAIKSFSMSDGGVMNVVFRNNGKNAYTVNRFDLSDDGGTTWYPVYSLEVALPIGAESANLQNGTATTGTLATQLDCSAGSKYAYDVQINYTDGSTGATYMFLGTQKLEGNCAQ